MLEFVPVLIALACPLSMAAMMAMPAIRRVFRTTSQEHAAGGS